MVEDKFKKNSDARIKANAKYDAQWVKLYGIKFNRKYEADVIDVLDNVPNKRQYLRDLIRADIAKRGDKIFEEEDSKAESEED